MAGRPSAPTTVTEDARECATIAASFEAPADNMPALVAQLIEGKALTPAFLIRAVAAGQTLSSRAALAALAKVRRRGCAALIASGRAANLRALLAEGRLAAEDVSRLRRGGRRDPQKRRSAGRRTATIAARRFSSTRSWREYQRRPDRELDSDPGAAPPLRRARPSAPPRATTRMSSWRRRRGATPVQIKRIWRE